MEASLYLIVVVSLLADMVQSCSFPDFMQSRPDDVTRREWNTHIMEDGQDSRETYELIVSFHGNRMRATQSTSSGEKERSRSYTRQCLLILNGKYLVSHKFHHKTEEVYLCMEFIKRSNDVVQIKKSKFSKYQDPTLCTENRMFLNDWPLVNKANLYSSYQPCPLVGGFTVKLFDKRREQGVCDAFNGETRIESECMRGEGMYFRFRHRNCVPDGLRMSENQKTFCIGTWEDDRFTYSVLRHEKEDRLWCLRFPTDNSGAFRAYLFRDLYCERSEFPTKSNQYIAIDFTREPPRSLSQLCVDDYEACKFWGQPCRHAGSTMQMTCAKRCGICSASYPAVCTLPAGIRGHWEEQNKNGRERVDISDMMFSKERHADFRCIQWHFSPFEPELTFMEQMFVATFDNGCRPRYTCAQFKKHTASILRYKMSESQIWPFKDANALAVDCSAFKYKDAGEPFTDTYQSRHFKVLVSSSERVYSSCRLEQEKKFHVTFSGGSECDGVLTQEGFSAKNKLKLILEGCPGMPREQHFGCLDSSGHGYISNLLIVSETIDSQNSVRCWMFPSYPEYTFYLLPHSHCNEGANDKIISGQFNPMATFKEFPPTTTTTTTTRATPSGVVVDDIIKLDNQKYQKSIDSDDWTVGEEEYDGEDPDPDSIRKEYSIDYADSKSGKLREAKDSGASIFARTNVGTLLVCIVIALWGKNSNR